MRKILLKISLLIFILVGGVSCRTDEVINPTDYESLPIAARNASDFAVGEPVGLYLLNEGNMGSNKASIDYVDFVNARYVRNIYTERNPTAVKELGDVGNDIQIYGNRLYAVINCSHKVEVMDAKTCCRIGQIDVPNCRFIRFSGGKCYVSSYVGPVSIDPDAQLGAVFEIDTATLQVTRQVSVGYQPDELDILGDYIFVANSGGYRAPNYDSTLSVVDLASMTQVAKIPVGLNLHRVRHDGYGQLWVTSRGDYANVPARLMVVDGKNLAVIDTLDIACSDMDIVGDSLYFYSTAWSNQTESNAITYGIIDVRTRQLVSSQLITDGTEGDIKVPYGIAVNPYTRDIYLTDAKNYVSSGMLHCYDKNGRKLWSIRTGDIPAHMTFVNH